MLKKVWEVIGLFVVVIIVVNIVSESIQPFLPMIGMILSALVLIAAAVFLTRLVISKRRFW